MELVQYVKKAAEAVNTAYFSYEAALMKKNAEIEKVKTRSASDSSYTNLQATEDSEKIVAEFDSANKALQETFKNAVAGIRGDFENVVHEFYRPDGEKINAADMALLNSGLEMTRNEVFEIIVRNADNVTMLRLLADYVGKTKKMKDIPTAIERALFRAKKAGTVEMTAFDNFVHLASMGLGHQDDSYLHYWRRLSEYEEDAKAALEKSKVYITPEELDAIEHAEIERKSNYSPLTKNKSTGDPTYTFH